MKEFKYPMAWNLLGILGLLAIMVASLWPQAPGPSIPHLDKVLHFSVYTIASFYYFQLMHKSKYKLTFIALFLYSVLIEFLQYSLGGRTAEVYDAIANFIGVSMGLYLNGKLDLIKRIERLIA